MVNYLAQVKLPDGTIIDNPPGFKSEFTSLSSIVSMALPILFAIAGIILLVFLVWGGFDFLLAMGDPKKAEMGKKKITNALLGFFLIFAAYWITQIVDFIFKLGVYSP